MCFPHNICTHYIFSINEGGKNYITNLDFFIFSFHPLIEWQRSQKYPSIKGGLFIEQTPLSEITKLLRLRKYELGENKKNVKQFSSNPFISRIFYSDLITWLSCYNCSVSSIARRPEVWQDLTRETTSWSGWILDRLVPPPPTSKGTC